LTFLKINRFCEKNIPSKNAKESLSKIKIISWKVIRLPYQQALIKLEVAAVKVTAIVVTVIIVKMVLMENKTNQPAEKIAFKIIF